MVAMPIYSVTTVLWKETAFPLCPAMVRRWKRNVVSRMSSVTVVIIIMPIPAFTSPAVCCCVFQSHVFRPCIFDRPAFFGLAFSVSPTTIRYEMLVCRGRTVSLSIICTLSNDDPWCGRVNQSINQLFINSKRTKLPVTSQ